MLLAIDHTRHDSQKPKRRRAGGPKVKTGCGTCKIRRVKCDELKPICQECQRKGLTCEGYVVSRSTSSSRSRSHSPSQATDVVGGHQSLASINGCTTLLVLPGRRVFASDDDYQSFTAFENGMARQLYASMPCELWHVFALQLSYSNEAVSKAVMCLGVLSRGLQIHKTAVRLGSSQDANAAQTRKLAISYYGGALYHLREDLLSSPERPSEKMLQGSLCCLLLGTFEFLCGNIAQLRLHVQASSRILRLFGSTCNDANSANGSSAWRTSSTISKMHQQLARIHNMFAMMATHILGIPLPTCGDSGLDLNMLYTAPLPTQTSRNLFDIDDELALLRLAHRNLGKHSTAAVDDDDDICPQEAEQIAALTRRLELINTQTDAIVSKTKHSLDRLMHKLVKVNIWQAKVELTNDDLSNVDYTYVLDIAEEVLTEEHHQDLLDRIFFERPRYHIKDYIGELEPLFNFVTILIELLFFVATHSADRAAQSRAIDLLSSRSWREGGWDSAVMANIARTKMGLETA